MTTFVFLFYVLRVTVAPDSQLSLISAIEQHESDCDSHAVKDKCYGCLQIGQKCLDDVNRNCGTSYALKDVLGNRDLSVEIFQAYIEMYATEKRIGRKPTAEDMARIWNGGPDGWKMRGTLGYWHKVKRRMSPS